jgi:hypothetical protein
LALYEMATSPPGLFTASSPPPHWPRQSWPSLVR